MPDSKDAFKQQLEELRREYKRKLPSRVEELLSAWASATKQGVDFTELHKVVRLLHTLAGSGTTFGYPEITRVSREAEHYFREIVENTSGLGPEQRQVFDNTIDQLQQSIESGEQSDSPLDSAITPRRTEQSGQKQYIYVLEDDSDLRANLVNQLVQYGYEAEGHETVASFRQALDAELPDLIIVDIELGDGNGLDVIDELNKRSTEHIPVIVSSQWGTLQNRIEAVRLGVDSFFAKPYEITRLIDAIDSLIGRDLKEPYRVMIVDDDQSVAGFISFTLQQSGIQTFVVIRPDEILEAIDEFRPELILTDVYMPDFSGPELAAVIRHHEDYVGIPIVYLSSETNVVKQLDAMSRGADDFLTKPIDPVLLLGTIINRVERYRKLNCLMVHDSLTGLLNHTASKRQLEAELNRAEREKQNFCYAMLDIDHFKKVNDTYGHAAGDRVIKSLSRLLTHRLRKTDAIGRYGGEEFVIILPNTTIGDAREILNGLRSDFSTVLHQQEKVTFCCTFSCGLAEYPAHTSAAELHEAADQALYQAKQQGRNRVCI